MKQANAIGRLGVLTTAAGLALAGVLAATEAPSFAGKPGGGGGGGTTNPPDIAYLVHGSYSALYVMQDDGSGQTAVLQGQFDCGPPSWSPDGTRLAFPSSVQGWGIYTIRPDGTGLTKVTSTLQPEGGVVDGASWSPTLPDGKQWIAFRDRDELSLLDLYIVEPVSGMRMRLTNSTSLESAGEWASDGRLLFRLGRDLYAVDFSLATGGTLVASAPTIVYTLPAGAGRGVPARNNPNLVLTDLPAFVEPYRNKDLFVLDLAAPLSDTNPRNVTRTPDVEEEARSWSPDDRYVLCTGYGTGGIVRVDVATGVRTLLARHNKGKELFSPDWRR